VLANRFLSTLENLPALLYTRCLPAAIACHAVYNLSMVSLSLLAGAF
jgi:hypothetical protein